MVCYDLEFTGTPRWTAQRDLYIPDQEMVEIAAYHPASEKTFSRLVRPVQYALSEEAAQLTGLTQEQLQRDGVPVGQVLESFFAWISNCTQQTAEESKENASSSAHNLVPDANDCNSQALARRGSVMLISHGGLLHDARMIRHYSTQSSLSIPSYLYFADSYKLLRECTRNKGSDLTSLKLEALLNQFEIIPLEQHHRALSDAIGTWKVLQAAILQYGTKYFTPSQEIARKYMSWKRGDGSKK